MCFKQWQVWAPPAPFLPHSHPIPTGREDPLLLGGDRPGVGGQQQEGQPSLESGGRHTPTVSWCGDRLFYPHPLLGSAGQRGLCSGVTNLRCPTETEGHGKEPTCSVPSICRGVHLEPRGLGVSPSSAASSCGISQGVSPVYSPVKWGSCWCSEDAQGSETRAWSAWGLREQPLPSWAWEVAALGRGGSWTPAGLTQRPDPTPRPEEHTEFLSAHTPACAGKQSFAYTRPDQVALLLLGFRVGGNQEPGKRPAAAGRPQPAGKASGPSVTGLGR